MELIDLGRTHNQVGYTLTARCKINRQDKKINNYIDKLFKIFIHPY